MENKININNKNIEGNQNNVSEFIIQILENIGINRAFCLTGGMSMHINNAAHKSKIKITYCNHEQAVVAAADGNSRANNYIVPGLAIVTSGPGVTNTITAVASAFYDSTPLIILSGQVKSNDINKYKVRSYGAQETPQLELMGLVTKKTLMYDDSKISDEYLSSIILHCMTGRKGPIYIEIPLDVQNKKIENFIERSNYISAMILENIKKPNHNIRVPLKWEKEFKQSLRPLIVIGNGLKLANINKKYIKSLINSNKVPVLLTWASFDLLDYDNPFNFGCAGGLAPTHSNKILQQSDCILFLGVRLDLLTTAFNPNKYGKTSNKFLIDIDSKEINKNKRNIENLKTLNVDLNYIKELFKNISFHNKNNEWIEECKILKKIDNENEIRKLKSNKLSTYNIASLLSINTDYINCVCSSSGNAIETFARFYRNNGKTNFIWSGHCLGSMGLGLPTAVGAAVDKTKLTACIEGDGGILLNIQELFTLKANKNIKIHIFILNNKGYKSIINSQLKAFGHTFGSNTENGLSENNFKLIAEAAEIKYVKCTSIRSFEKELNNNKNINQVIFDLMINDDIYRGPSVQTLFDKEGKPYSTELDDINWN
jgi:acetolactate synthase-1/2/3 large subunit